MADYLTAGRIFLALGIVSVVVLGATYLDASLSLEMIALSVLTAFFVTLGVYSFNQVTDYEEDRVNKPNSVVISGRKSPRQILYFSFLCKALAIALAFAIGQAAFLLICSVVLIGFVYSFKLPGLVRLKEIFIVKNITVSTVWSLMVIVPVFASNAAFQPEFLIVMAFVFLHNLMGVLNADLKDTDGDLKSGLKTIPGVVGKNGTLLLIFGLNTLALLLLVLGIAFWDVKSYLILLSLVSIWRYYRFWVIYRKELNHVYFRMEDPAYVLLGLLAVMGRIAGL